MRKTGILYCFIFFLAFSATAEEREITIALMDSNVPPYILGEGGLLQQDRPGVLVEIMQLVEQELAIRIIFKRFPMSRSFKMIGKGDVDGCFPLSFKTKRLQFARYPMTENKPDTSKRLTAESLSIYKLKGSTVGWDGKTITNLTKPIGVHREYAIADSLKKIYPVEDVTKHTPQNFERLIRNRISVVVDFEIPTDIILNSHPRLKERVTKLEPPLITKEYYLVFSHQFVAKHPERSKEIWNAIEQIRQKHLIRLMRLYSE